VKTSKEPVASSSDCGRECPVEIYVNIMQIILWVGSHE
jgi:hypothetical protein